MSSQIDRVAPVLATISLVAIILFQLALALGVPWGHAAYGGTHADLTLPFRISSGVAVVLWSVVLLIVCQLAGFDTWPLVSERWLITAGRVLVSVLIIAVIMNAFTPSHIERLIWFPTTIILLACVAWITARLQA